MVSMITSTVLSVCMVLVVLQPMASAAQARLHSCESLSGNPFKAFGIVTGLYAFDTVFFNP